MGVCPENGNVQVTFNCHTEGLHGYSEGAEDNVAKAGSRGA